MYFLSFFCILICFSLGKWPVITFVSIIGAGKNIIILNIIIFTEYLAIYLLPLCWVNNQFNQNRECVLFIIFLPWKCNESSVLPPKMMKIENNMKIWSLTNLKPWAKWDKVGIAII